MMNKLTISLISSRREFLDLGTIDILGRIILVGEGERVATMCITECLVVSLASTH